MTLADNVFDTTTAARQGAVPLSKADTGTPSSVSVAPSPREVDDYISTRYATDASIWQGLGVSSADEARAWVQRGIKATAFVSWRRHGVTDQQILGWVAVGLFRYDQAAAWIKTGFTPAAAEPWVRIGLTCSKSGEFIRAGFTVDEVAAWLGTLGKDARVSPAYMRRANESGLTLSAICDLAERLRVHPSSMSLPPLVGAWETLGEDTMRRLADAGIDGTASLAACEASPLLIQDVLRLCCQRLNGEQVIVPSWPQPVFARPPTPDQIAMLWGQHLRVGYWLHCQWGAAERWAWVVKSIDPADAQTGIRLCFQSLPKPVGGTRSSSPLSDMIAVGVALMDTTTAFDPTHTERNGTP